MLPKTKRTIITLLIAAGGIAVLILYALHDPSHSHLAPKCLLRALTGYDCPSYGIQRALHALLCGEWSLAVRYNPILCLSIPYIAVAMFGAWGKGEIAERCGRWAFHRYTLWAYVALLLVWWVFRNTATWHAIANLPQ